MIIENEVLKLFSGRQLDQESTVYLEKHCRRFARLINIVSDIRSSIDSSIVTFLDIGPSFFTELLKIRFGGDEVLSLGFNEPNTRGGHFPLSVSYDKGTFFRFDLNDSQFPEKWISLPPCDIVVLAEVIEHLYTSPRIVLKFINSFMKPGGLLVIQTPNAAALEKRIKLLLGKNPYEMIRDNRDNPGHFREYTMRELKHAAISIGFEIVMQKYQNYFNRERLIGKVYTSLQRILPDSFRDGITITLRKCKK